MPKRITALENLGVMDLVEMRAEIERELDSKIAVERREVQARLSLLDAYQPASAGHPIRHVSARRGVDAWDGRSRTKLKGRKAPIKYRGPNGEMWSGRGSTPRWLALLETRGRRRDGYLV